MEESTVKLSARKELKQRARHVVKTHFVFLVILCLVAVFYGTEFNYVRSAGENFYSFITGQPIEIAGQNLKLNSDISRNKVLQDLIDDNISAGRYHAANQMENYKNQKMTNDILGRKNGIFAAIANYASSGNFVMLIFNGLHSIVHSSKVATGIIVALSMLLSLAVWIFIKNIITGILRRVYLEARLYQEIPVSHLLHFRLVHRWMKASLTLLLTKVFGYLWTLTIVGGPIKHYSYFLVPYIVAENPDIKPLDAITLSRKMMYGHKWECFKLEFSFVGWVILGVLTFGVEEILWGIPYRLATFSEYYAEMRLLAKENNIPGAEMLNDTYLFEKADEAFLRETYPDIEKAKAFIDANRVTLTGAKAFFVKNFSLWIGTDDEKLVYDVVDKRRQQIVEDRAAIKRKLYPHRLNPLWTENNNKIVRNIRYIRTYTIWSIIICFFIFAFVGWAWEVGIHLVKDGIFVNRGVSHGPWLPIYGGGVVMIVVMLARWRSNPLKEAVSIVVLCGFVEYFTSLFLEVTKGMRWWDYTGYFLNLNGRICAEGLMIFAIGGMAAVYLLVPIIDNWLYRIKPKYVKMIAIALLVIFAADLVYSHFVPNAGDGITDYSAYEQIEAPSSSTGG